MGVEQWLNNHLTERERKRERRRNKRSLRFHKKTESVFANNIHKKQKCSEYKNLPTLRQPIDPRHKLLFRAKGARGNSGIIRWWKEGCVGQGGFSFKFTIGGLDRMFPLGHPVRLWCCVWFLLQWWQLSLRGYLPSLWGYCLSHQSVSLFFLLSFFLVD